MYRYAAVIKKDEEEADLSYPASNFKEGYEHLINSIDDEWEIISIVRKESLNSI